MTVAREGSLLHFPSTVPGGELGLRLLTDFLVISLFNNVHPQVRSFNQTTWESWLFYSNLDENVCSWTICSYFSTSSSMPYIVSAVSPTSRVPRHSAIFVSRRPDGAVLHLDFKYGHLCSPSGLHGSPYSRGTRRTAASNRYTRSSPGAYSSL